MVFWRWRKATWALAVFNVLMLVWVVSGLQATSGTCSHETTYASACQTGAAIGTGIGITILAVIWFLGFIVLSLVWLMSRATKRQCPQCGRDVKKGAFVCKGCAYDFRAPAPVYDATQARVS